MEPKRSPAEVQPAPRHLRIVPPGHRSPAEQRRRTRLLLACAAVASAIVVFSLVYLHVISTEKQFTIDHLSSTQTQLQQRYEDLRLQADKAAAPANIMHAASRLGMVTPGYENFIKAPKGSATPPSADPTPANGRLAPGGVSDWPQVKSDLAGQS